MPHLIVSWWFIIIFWTPLNHAMRDEVLEANARRSKKWMYEKNINRYLLMVEGKLSCTGSDQMWVARVWQRVKRATLSRLGCVIHTFEWLFLKWTSFWNYCLTFTLVDCAFFVFICNQLLHQKNRFYQQVT